MAENGKFVERRKRRPHQDWHFWYTIWRTALDPLVLELKELKTSRARHGLGAPERQRRAAILRGQVRLLLKIRRNVREEARVAAQSGTRSPRGLDLATQATVTGFSQNR